MARVSRLGGALLAESEKQYFLIGDLKEPCDFVHAGFEPPGPIDPKAQPYVRLSPTRPIELEGPWLTVGVEGEALASLLHERLVIARNGSVSERLWRLLTHEHDGAVEVPARWFGEIPSTVWGLVRESVLRCS
jgi:hypothetical protein